MSDVIDLEPADAPIKYYEGDDLAIPFTLYEDGAVADITTWTLEAKFDPATGATVTATVTKTDAVNGEFEITHPAASMDDFTPGGDHYWDLVRTDTNQTLLAGKFHVRADRVS